MIIAIIVAHAWGVAQLIVLGSFARTIRARTVFASMAVGLYACAPLTALLQVAWTRLAAPVIGITTQQLVGTASYTLDPFVEEIMKMLPLALLLMIPTYRRQWSFTDFVLIGAATGAGFGLAEDLYRFGASADRGQAIAGGWAVALTRTYALIPSVGETLTSWLPTGVARSYENSRLNCHLIWSAIGGLAVALALLKRTTAARVTAASLFLCIGLDHAAGNVTDIANTWPAFLAIPLGALARLRGAMPIAAIAVAWWLDQQRQRTNDSREPLLEAEQSSSSRILGTLGAAVSRIPWSLPLVDRFVRLRRAYNTERASTPAAPNELYTAVVNERDRVDRELVQLRINVPALLPPDWTLSALKVAIRRPAVVIWLVVMIPSVLWFVVGGWPQTARLQAFMMGPLVWKILFPISVLAQAWLAWRAIVGLRAWSQTRGLLIGDDAAVVGLRLACGVGAVGLGAFSLMRLLGGLPPGSSLLSNLHAQEAANRLTPGGGSMLADGAAAFAPPPPSVDLPDNSDSSSNTTSKSNADSDRAAPAPPKTNTPPPTPKPPDDPVAARARAAAADALEAQQRRRQAQNALDAADISQATADPGADANVAAARARARQAHDAADAAGIAASDEFDDPWGGKNDKKAAADQTRRDAKQADADQRAAEEEFWRKKAADVDAAKAAEKQAETDMNAADQKAAATQADVDAKAEAAQKAAAQTAAAQRKAADPTGVAAEETAEAATAAQRHADQAFYDTSDPSGKAYRDALEAARLAKERADAAKAAADAARAAREARIPPTRSTPDKP